MHSPWTLICLSPPSLFSPPHTPPFRVPSSSSSIVVTTQPPTHIVALFSHPALQGCLPPLLASAPPHVASLPLPMPRHDAGGCYQSMAAVWMRLIRTLGRPNGLDQRHDPLAKLILERGRTRSRTTVSSRALSLALSHPPPSTPSPRPSPPLQAPLVSLSKRDPPARLVVRLARASGAASCCA